MVLVVYDTSGKVLYQVAGTYEPPSGIPYLEADIDPNREYVTGVDVSKNPHEPIIGAREDLYVGGEGGVEPAAGTGENVQAPQPDNDEVFAQILLGQARIMAMLLGTQSEKGEADVRVDREVL
ncbi:MAG: hypothetical protein K2P87_01710 [Lachnospiraceae bacterium]|nr:hypothetical protein [Lachnospiraceae bacterium]